MQESPVRKYGKIRVFGYRKTQAGDRVSYPNIKGYTNIAAWSRGKDPWKELSPFFLGPFLFDEMVPRKYVDKKYLKRSKNNNNNNNNNEEQEELDPDELIVVEKKVYNLENFWQSAKVYKKTVKQNQKEWSWPAEQHIDKHDQKQEPNAAWYKWHDALLRSKQPIRHPNGTVKTGGVPEYAWWRGEKLGVVESRKQIYIPYIQLLYRDHDVYKQLLKKVRHGENVIIIEPDGPPPEIYQHGILVDYNLLLALQDITRVGDIPGFDKKLTASGIKNFNKNQYQPYGHGFCAALTLIEDLYNLVEQGSQQDMFDEEKSEK